MKEKSFEKENLYNSSPEGKLVDVPAKTFSIDNPEGEPIIIKQFEDDSESIIKISRKENIYRFSLDDVAPIESARTIEIQNQAKEEFEELNDDYGISVAPFEYRIIRDEETKENVLYCISEKIHGDNLITKLKEKDFSNQIKNVEKLLISLTNYFKNKYREGNRYLGDVANIGNYIYGHRKDETEDKLYLIDTEPVLVSLKTPQWKEFFNERVLKHLLEQIEYIEKETGKELAVAHKEYEDLAKEVSRNKED